MKVKRLKKIMRKTETQVLDMMAKILEDREYDVVVSDTAVTHYSSSYNNAKWFTWGSTKKKKTHAAIERAFVLGVPKTPIPVLLVAHADTAHYTEPDEIYYDQASRVMWSPQGLGADDRAGVAAIIELIEFGYRPYVLITNGEESGGWGASAAIDALRGLDFRIMVQIDRRGGNHAVYYGCANHDFKQYVLGTTGFTNQGHGSFSDISILAPALGICGVNLATGYISEHTSSERLYLDLWEETVKAVEAILLSPPAETMNYVEAKYTYKKKGVASELYQQDEFASMYGPYIEAEILDEKYTCQMCNDSLREGEYVVFCAGCVTEISDNIGISVDQIISSCNKSPFIGHHWCYFCGYEITYFGGWKEAAVSCKECANTLADSALEVELSISKLRKEVEA